MMRLNSEREIRRFQSRHLRLRDLPDGMTAITGQLPRLDGLRLKASLDATAEKLRKADDRLTREHRYVDTTMAIAAGDGTTAQLTITMQQPSPLPPHPAGPAATDAATHDAVIDLRDGLDPLLASPAAAGLAPHAALPDGQTPTGPELLTLCCSPAITPILVSPDPDHPRLTHQAAEPPAIGNDPHRFARPDTKSGRPRTKILHPVQRKALELRDRG